MPRPRSESARAAVLGAVTALVAEDGYGRLSMEAIARRAGVSKQTVYRWWPTKAAVVLEALNEGAQVIAPADGDAREFLRRTVRGAHRNRALLAGLMAEAQLDDAFARSFRDDFLARRRAVLRELLEPDPEAEQLAELVFARLWYRLLARSGPLDRRFADELWETVRRRTH